VRALGARKGFKKGGTLLNIAFGKRKRQEKKKRGARERTSAVCPFGRKKGEEKREKHKTADFENLETPQPLEKWTAKLELET